jgi:threonine/homoserine/homoserine lactone efflux protein
MNAIRKTDKTVNRKRVLATLRVFVTLNYLYFSAIQIACTALIVWLAWTWRAQKETAA